MAKAKKKVKKKAVKDKAISKHKPPNPVRVHFGPRKRVEPEKPAEQAPAKQKITPYPQAGKKVQEFEDTLDKQLAGDTAPPKRPVGRPPKEQEPEPSGLPIDIVAGVIKIPFELWAIGQDVKELALTEPEAKQIAEPARQLLEYYLPKIPVIVYAWVSLSVSSFWVMRTRLLLIQELKKQREKQQPPRPAAPAQPGVTTSFPEGTETVRV